MQSVVMMVSVSNASQVVAALDVFAVLLASLGHDLAHPGVTAAFLVQTRHELAMTYNDTSVLENMHTARLFGILKEQASNVLAALPESDWRDLRKTVVASVLATDMVHHFKMVSDVEVFCEMNEAALQNPEECAELFKTEKNTHFLLSLFIHSADIGNPAASWTSCERWAHRVMDEFFAQGDRERELGMPVSAMFDRETVVRPVMQVRGRARARALFVCFSLPPSPSLSRFLPWWLSLTAIPIRFPFALFSVSAHSFPQVNFIEFVVAPLYGALVKLCPPLHTMGQQLVSNREEWGRQSIALVEDGNERAEATGKEKGRFAAFEAKWAHFNTDVRGDVVPRPTASGRSRAASPPPLTPVRKGASIQMMDIGEGEGEEGHDDDG
jgi:hypothetical protein